MFASCQLPRPDRSPSTQSPISLLSALLLALLAAPIVASLGAQGVVRGRVLAVDGRTPTPGAVVRIAGTTFAMQAAPSGEFAFLRVPAGTHQVEALAPGHTIESRWVQLASGDTITLELRLAAAPRELAAVEVIGAASDALARIPGSAAAVGQRQLDAMQPVSANEVLRTIPGVHLQDEEGAGLRANIGIRGLDPDRSRSVLVLEDGIPVALAPYGEPEMYYSPPIDRMARVEVIKGSGSILFGPQTIGGVVNYVTLDPSSSWTGRVDARGGSGAQELVRVRFGGTHGAARGIVSAFHRAANDLNGLHYQIQDATLKTGVRTAFGDVGAKLSLYREGSNATYVGLTDSLYRASPLMHPMPTDQLAVGREALTLSHHVSLGAGQLRTTAYAYRTERNWMRRDYTYGSTGGTIIPGSASGGRNRAFAVGGIEPRYRTLWSAGGITSDLEVGARLHLERARDQYVSASATGTPTGVRDDETRTGAAAAAWVQNRFALSPTFEVTPGVRAELFSFDRHITRMRVRRSDGTTTTRASEDVNIRSGDTVRELIPGIGATWSPRELLTVFAGVHRGFAPPRTKDALIYGDPTLAPGAQVPDPVSLELDAERSWNYEVGTRVRPARGVSFEATLFLLDFTNQIIEPSLSAGSASAAALANQGATRHQGIELGAAFDVGALAGRAESLVLEAHWTFSDARFSRDRLLRQGSDTVNVRGNVLPYAPRGRTHVGLAYEGGAGLMVRLDAIHVGAQFTDNFETVPGSANGRVGRIPAYATVDATARYRLPGLPGVELSAALKNLADARYIASRRPEGIKVGAPRLLQVGMAWDF